jgi:uncharacterized protein YukE
VNTLPTLLGRPTYGPDLTRRASKPRSKPRGSTVATQPTNDGIVSKKVRQFAIEHLGYSEDFDFTNLTDSQIQQLNEHIAAHNEEVHARQEEMETIVQDLEGIRAVLYEEWTKPDEDRFLKAQISFLERVEKAADAIRDHRELNTNILRLMNNLNSRRMRAKKTFLVNEDNLWNPVPVDATITSDEYRAILLSVPRIVTLLQEILERFTMRPIVEATGEPRVDFARVPIINFQFRKAFAKLLQDHYGLRAAWLAIPKFILHPTFSSVGKATTPWSWDDYVSTRRIIPWAQIYHPSLFTDVKSQIPVFIESYEKLRNLLMIPDQRERKTTH